MRAPWQLFLRRDTRDELLEELGREVLAEPEGAGRTTLVDIVSGGERSASQAFTLSG